MTGVLGFDVQVRVEDTKSNYAMWWSIDACEASYVRRLVLVLIWFGIREASVGIAVSVGAVLETCGIKGIALNSNPRCNIVAVASSCVDAAP